MIVGEDDEWTGEEFLVRRFPKVSRETYLFFLGSLYRAVKNLDFDESEL